MTMQTTTWQPGVLAPLGSAELEAFPLSGCVFSMRVDVPGLPVNFWAD